MEQLQKRSLCYLSSTHTQASIGQTHKPEVIEFCHGTKSVFLRNAGVVNSWILHQQKATNEEDAADADVALMRPWQSRSSESL